MTQLMPPDLTGFRWIVINSSSGKDSATALRVTVQLARQQGVPMERLVVSHQCLGTMEWKGAAELAQKQAEHYGLRFEISRYRNKAGVELTLLEYIRKHGKWPDSKNRYCTSDFKRGPGGRVLVKLFKESPGDIVNVFGFRAEESKSRALRKVWEKNRRFSSAGRTVMDWLPIHDWSVDQVWKSIQESGVPVHPAYQQGMSRLSCVFCVFAPKHELMAAGRANPALLDQYVEAEDQMKHTFRSKLSIREVRDAIQAGDTTPGDDGWKL